MNPSEEEPTVPRTLPDELVESVDGLDAPVLRELSAYVERRLAVMSEPLPEMIREEASGEILDIEDRGAYTLVRKRSPTGEDPRPISVYHVSRQIPTDDVTLHWSFIGDVHDPE